LTQLKPAFIFTFPAPEQSASIEPANDKLKTERGMNRRQHEASLPDGILEGSIMISPEKLTHWQMKSQISYKLCLLNLYILTL
jgi:hypothetical protein